MRLFFWGIVLWLEELRTRRFDIWFWKAFFWGGRELSGHLGFCRVFAEYLQGFAGLWELFFFFFSNGFFVMISLLAIVVDDDDDDNGWKGVFDLDTPLPY